MVDALFRQQLAVGAVSHNDQRPGQLYILHGEETYLRDHYLGKLREQLLAGGMGEFNLHELGAKDMSPHAVEEAVDCLPMMGERTLVLVTDYDLFKAGEKDREAYAKLLGSLPDYCCVVLVYDLIPYKGDARTKLAAALKQHGTVVNFVRQDQGDLVDWVRRRFRALGKDIDRQTAEYLIFTCGGLMTGLVPEIAKIGAYAKGRAITQKDIDAVADPVLSAEVFRLSDAVLQGNYDGAARILGDLLKMQTEPIMILAALGSQLRRIYTARMAIDSGKDKYWLMELWEMKSDYPAKLLLSAAKKTTAAWCADAVQMCQVLDRRMKSEKGVDAVGELKLLLVRLGAQRR